MLTLICTAYVPTVSHIHMSPFRMRCHRKKQKERYSQNNITLFFFFSLFCSVAVESFLAHSKMTCSVCDACSSKLKMNASFLWRTMHCTFGWIVQICNFRSFSLREMSFFQLFFAHSFRKCIQFLYGILHILLHMGHGPICIAFLYGSFHSSYQVPVDDVYTFCEEIRFRYFFHSYYYYCCCCCFWCVVAVTVCTFLWLLKL